ncbi:methylesterase 17-like isoform X1 [Chenopodium quinoa]|uniref:AB hydrolase-1 domain-containing protein n=1 Tax=Chenopodium quinoa TaxID=63459 RepID=A0A803MJK5_CHEQI|nr:methylesterase 17-like isoform X1 [Chenopodium quinoa]
MGEEVLDNNMSKLSSSSSLSPHFILVHGVSHGAWCWYKVRALLETSGCSVTCIDLKGSGIEPSDPNFVVSFHDYNHPLVDLLTSLPNQEKVILVGHSAGGISVTEAIHKFPEKIEAAVYVGATMLKLGFHSDQDVKDGAPDLSEYGEAYDLGFGLGMDQPPTSAIIKKELQRKILYQMTSIEDSTLAAMLLRPFPLAITKAQSEEGKDSERVARIYIKTLEDRVIKAEQQDAMIKR